MDSEAMLKSYCGSVFKIHHKYGWMMDSYVLDFFTKDLWKKLPYKWTNVLHELQPNEIAYYFLEFSAQKDVHVHNSQKPTFRKVWPLELLAFLATCHSLNLKNQPWMKKKMLDTQCSQQEDMLGKSVQKTTTLAHVDSAVEKQTAVEVGRGIRKSPNEMTCSHQPDNSSQNVHLSHAFRCNIKPKKQHEIEVLSKDVGAGLGHLSRLLSYGCFLHVVTIEGDGCHKTGAEKLDRKLVNHLQKQQAAQEQTNRVVQPMNGSLIHLTHHINADISVEEFSNVVSEAFDQMKKLPNEDDVTNTASKNLHSKGSCENFIIVGLHTCGDLASTLLRVFTQCKNAVGIVSVGCCYIKLSHEMSNLEKTLPKRDRQDSDTASEQASTKKNREDSDTPSEQALTKKDGQDSDTASKQALTKKDGQDSDTASKQALTKKDGQDSDTPSEQALTKKNREDSDTPSEQALTKKDGQDFDGRNDLKVFGYPMSEYLKSIPYHQQSYSGLEVACHALDQYHKKLLENSPTLKLHYYRALLELLLQRKNPNCGRRQIRTLRTKKAAKMTFEEYARSACEILKIKEDCPTLEDIRHVEELHQGKECDVVVFYVLRLLLAPLIEGLILVDRLLFVKENSPGGVDAKISLLFHSNCSPRNMAIIAANTN